MTQLTFANHVYVDPPPESEDPDERYTTPETMAWCLKVAGLACDPRRPPAWDMDVAACEESHWAPVWYSKKDDGLSRPWAGNVWANPPWSDIRPWAERAWVEMLRVGGQVSTIGMLLPGNRTEQPWWHELVEPFRDCRRNRGAPGWPQTMPPPRVGLASHFLPGRTQYGSPGNPKAIGVGSPNFTSVFLVWRRPGAGRGKP